MATLQVKVEQLIRSQLQEGEADLTTLPNGRVSGHVIAKDFEQLDYEQRRALLRRLWGQHLLPEEAANISTILTYTPAEWQVPLPDDS